MPRLTPCGLFIRQLTRLSGWRSLGLMVSSILVEVLLNSRWLLSDVGKSYAQLVLCDPRTFSPTERTIHTVDYHQLHRFRLFNTLSAIFSKFPLSCFRRHQVFQRHLSHLDFSFWISALLLNWPKTWCQLTSVHHST